MARELFGLFLLFWGLLILLSLLTHSQADPSLNHVVSGSVAVKNGAGLFGAYLSGMLVDVFGFAAFVWPLFFVAWGAGCVSTLVKLPWWRWLGFLLLATCLLSLGTAWHLGLADVRGGGMLGRIIYARGTLLFSPAGFTLIWLFFLFISLELSFGIPWLDLIRRIWQFMRAQAQQHEINFARLRKGLSEALPRPSLPRLPLPQGRFGRNRAEGPLIIDLDVIMDDDATGTNAPPALAPANTGAQPATPGPKPEPESNPAAASGGVTRGANLPDFIFRDGPIAEHDLTDPFEPDEERTDPFDQNAGGAIFDQNAGGVIFDQDDTGFAFEPEETPPVRPVQPAASGPAQSAAAQPVFRTSVPTASGPTASGAPAVSGPVDMSGLSARNLLLADPQPAPLAPGPEYAQPERPRAEATFAAAPAGRPMAEPSHASAYTNPQANPQAARQAPPQANEPAQARPAAPRKRARTPLPHLELLTHPEPVPGAPPSRELLAEKGMRLMACLADFGIQGELAAITPGPVISMFEIRPAPGVKVSRILSLSDDLALALKAMAVRIQAPVPGSDTVGVEIPNDVRAIVSFCELLQDQSFSASAGPLSMALGKDIGGHPFTTDLSRMPHLLVAGATGAGKSVCLNSILLSFLYKCTPEDVRILLVDPKRIEMAVYADLPHLVHPVVTEVALAKTALEWAVHEMDSRYDAMARVGVRNIAGFNKKLAEFNGNPPPGLSDLAPLPFLVIIIDELADLMMTAGKDIETHIVRLAQLARAAGIHLIVATQRPSVDVVTGLIKANFPCRIAFQVSSKHDSRTILDTVGAEHLLGKGDMLFKPSGGKLQRLHGAFVSDEEVVAVVEYWKSRQAPDYAVDFNDWGNPEGPIIMPAGNNDSADNEEGLYNEVIAFVREQGKVSISLIQRRFRIGFNKAARFVEQMEQDGIIQPGDRQNKARQVNRGE